MQVRMKPIRLQQISFAIVGTSPLITHPWDEKAIREIQAAQAGKKTKNRTIRDPEAEFKACIYRTDELEPGIPLLAFKKSLIEAAHKDIGIEKTLVRKAFFIPCTDSGKIIPMECGEPRMRTDVVRVGTSGTDLRYRPEFWPWRVRISAEIDADLLQPEDVVNLVNRAGFGVGICEWRPQKGGEYGRFEFDVTEPFRVQEPESVTVQCAA